MEIYFKYHVVNTMYFTNYGSRKNLVKFCKRQFPEYIFVYGLIYIYKNWYIILNFSLHIRLFKYHFWLIHDPLDYCIVFVHLLLLVARFNNTATLLAQLNLSVSLSFLSPFAFIFIQSYSLCKHKQNKTRSSFSPVLWFIFFSYSFFNCLVSSL